MPFRRACCALTPLRSTTTVFGTRSDCPKMRRRSFANSHLRARHLNLSSVFKIRTDRRSIPSTIVIFQIGMGWKLLAHHVSSAFLFCCKLRWPSEQRLCRWEPFAQASSVSCFWRLLVRKVLCNFSTAQPFLVSCPVISHVGPRCPLQTIRSTST